MRAKTVSEEKLEMASICAQIMEIRVLRSAIGTASCYRDLGFCEGCARIKRLERDLLRFCVEAA